MGNIQIYLDIEFYLEFLSPFEMSKKACFKKTEIGKLMEMLYEVHNDT